MTYVAAYPHDEPARAAVDALAGATLLEFGASWCPHCLAAQAPLREALAAYPGLRHLKVEDGPGRPLGRSFQVKLWPTLILIRDGAESGRVVRPTTCEDIARLLTAV